jgi:hypothetical protein
MKIITLTAIVRRTLKMVCKLLTMSVSTGIMIHDILKILNAAARQEVARCLAYG